MDARFNRKELIGRILKIAACRGRIEVSCMDAVEFMREQSNDFCEKDLIYVDPPYFEKGRLLYYDAHEPGDHIAVAQFMSEITGPRWVVSYDDVVTIRNLYKFAPQLGYMLGYSARRHLQGREVMFFSTDMVVPELMPPLRQASGIGALTPVSAV